ncbi:MAG: hypothetical protein ACPL4E_00980 [Thermoproteota archaeon]
MAESSCQNTGTLENSGGKVPEIIITKEPKYPPRIAPWSLEDFMKIARKNLPENDLITH